MKWEVGAETRVQIMGDSNTVIRWWNGDIRFANAQGYVVTGIVRMLQDPFLFVEACRGHASTEVGRFLYTRASGCSTSRVG